MRKSVLLTLTLLIMFSLSVTIFAQDGAEVIGDADSEALSVVQNFLTSFDTSMLSENVRYSDTTFAQDQEGLDTVSSIYQQYYNGVFTEVSTQPIRFIVSGDGQFVVAEYTVSGVNSGDFGATPATGANVAIPTVSIFRVEDGMISEISTYSDQTALQQQLGLTTDGYIDPLTMGGGTTAGEQPMATATPVDGQTEASGETMTEEPGVSDMTEEADTGDTAGDTDTTDGVGTTDMTEESDVTETTDQTGDSTDAVTETDITEVPMDADTASGEAQPGTEVGLDAVLDDPDAYYGQRLTIEDELVEAVNGRVFMIQDDDLIDADQLAVIYTGDGSLDFDVFTVADEDLTVRVTGTLRQFFMSEFQTEFDMVDFGDEQFADWEEREVLVADHITLVEPVESE